MARANVPATIAQNPTSATVLSTVASRDEAWVSCSQKEESLKLSNAVLPKSTATTPTSPGVGGVPSRLFSGLRSTRVPSSRRPKNESRPTSVE